MKKILVALALLVLTAGVSFNLMSGALAQTTASQTVPGTYALAPQTNCIVGPCFLPNSSTNPIYVTTGAAGGTVTANPAANVSTSGTILGSDLSSTTTNNLAGGSMSITGTPTPGSFVSLAIPSGYQGISILVTGAWLGTLSFERSVDGGTTWTPYSAHVYGSPILLSAITQNGLYGANTAGITNFRVRQTLKTSGTPTITLVATVAPDLVYIGGGIKIVDGGGTVNQAFVTAPSTAPGAASPALVVAISPNSPVPLRTIVALDISTVTTGGTAVTALNAGHRNGGGFLFNPIGATVALCINEQGTASGTTSAGATTCVQPGQSYKLAPAAGAVSVITSDSSHPFSGYGLN